MIIKVSYFEKSKKYENCQRVGLQVYRDDINMYFHIDRHITFIEGKDDHYFLDSVMDFKGRNGKTAREEIEWFKTYVPIVDEKPKVEIAQVVKDTSVHIGKELTL